MRIVAGSQDEEDPTETELLQRLRAESDPLERIRMAAHASRLEWEQGMLEIESIVFRPEAQDPRLEELAQQGWHHKYGNTRAVVELLFPSDIRAPGVKETEIVDIAMAIDAAPTIRTLLEDWGWTFDRYERWLVDFIINQSSTQPGWPSMSTPDLATVLRNRRRLGRPARGLSSDE